MRSFVFIVCLLSNSFFTCSQFKESKIKLTSELNEISGITLFNDSLLLAINDSGNSAELYFVDLKGKIVHKALIENSMNTDWEDLCYDSIHEILYVGDFGNNMNTRRDLCIYKIPLSKNWKKDNLSAEKISFNYPDQKLFPPANENMEYDCEAMYLNRDSIYLITKSYSDPWRGFAKIYSLPTSPGNHTAHLEDSLLIGSSDWQHDAVTSGNYFNGKLEVLTYRKIMIFDNNTVFSHKSTYCFDKIMQREGICRLNDTTFIITAERHKLLGGPFLYFLTIQK